MVAEIHDTAAERVIAQIRHREQAFVAQTEFSAQCVLRVG
jgi:hypothetical protein